MPRELQFRWQLGGSIVIQLEYRRRLIPAIVLSAVAALAVLVGAGGAFAQSDYPNRPIRMIFGFPPGTDGGVRIVADKLSEALGRSVVVENVTGAAGNIAADRVAKAAADGYTIGAFTTPNVVINGSLYAKLPYDPIRDFAPVTQILSAPNVLVVNSDVPAKTVRDLIALARTDPGKLTFGHSGIGTTQHLAGEVMKRAAFIDIQQVPYRGTAQVAQDLLGGRITMSFLNTGGVVLPLVSEGKMRALAVTSRMRSPVLPEVPTMIEAGFADFDMTVWIGLFVPAGTPRSIVDRLNKEVSRIVALPEVRENFTSAGATPLFNSPEEFAAIIKVETAYWAKIIKDAGIAPIQ